MALVCGVNPLAKTFQKVGTNVLVLRNHLVPPSSHLIYIYVYINFPVYSLLTLRIYSAHTTIIRVSLHSSNTTTPDISVQPDHHVRPPPIQVQRHNDLRRLFRRRGARTQEARWYVSTVFPFFQFTLFQIVEWMLPYYLHRARNWVQPVANTSSIRRREVVRCITRYSDCYHHYRANAGLRDSVREDQEDGEEGQLGRDGRECYGCLMVAKRRAAGHGIGVQGTVHI